MEARGGRLCFWVLHFLALTVLIRNLVLVTRQGATPENTKDDKEYRWSCNHGSSGGELWESTRAKENSSLLMEPRQESQRLLYACWSAAATWSVSHSTLHILTVSRGKFVLFSTLRMQRMVTCIWRDFYGGYICTFKTWIQTLIAAGKSFWNDWTYTLKRARLQGK